MVGLILDQVNKQFTVVGLSRNSNMDDDDTINGNSTYSLILCYDGGHDLGGRMYYGVGRIVFTDNNSYTLGSKVTAEVVKSQNGSNLSSWAVDGKSLQKVIEEDI